MLDIRFYKDTGRYLDIYGTDEYMQEDLPDAPSATSIEVIAGKVVKYLLTEKGSDAFDPMYGGRALHYRQISTQFIPQLTFELYADVEACISFIKKAEENANVTGERLANVIVKDVRYDPVRYPNRLDVYIEIITTLGKRAVVVINNKTDE